MEFRRHFEDVRVLPFALLAKDPEKFTAIFCEYCEIPVPDGIEYRSVNFSRSHTFSLIRCYMNRLWVRFGVRRWDNLYLDMMKHYVARVDGVWRKIREVIK